MRPSFSKVSVLTLGVFLSLTGCSDSSTGPEAQDHRLFLSASAGGTHTCGVTLDLHLHCWGGNHYGQLGDGSEENKGLPTPVGTGVEFSLVSAGWRHTCALTPGGIAYCWGENEVGELGIGTTEGRNTPTRVSTDLRFSSISVGWVHTCALEESGVAHCWGLDPFLGSTCRSGENCGLVPQRVDTEVRFLELSAGAKHTCGLAASGDLYCWGLNQNGELGTSTTQLCGSDPGAACSTIPIRVSGGIYWEGVSAGSGHTCALSQEERVYCWGHAGNGRLGDGVDPSPEGFRTNPLPVAGESTFLDLSAGFDHTCAVSTEGPTYCWGSRGLGHGSAEGSALPVEVATEARFATLATGEDHSCGLTPGGALYCWGSNAQGQVGDGSFSMGWPIPVVVRW